MIIRVTQKLEKKLKLKSLPRLERDTSHFSDWHTNLIKLGQYQIILLTNTHSLVSFVFRGAGLNNTKSFIEKMMKSIHEYLTYWDLPGIDIDKIIKIEDGIVFSKTESRSVLGSMNDFAYYVSYTGFEGSIYLGDVSLKINMMPMSMIDMNYPMDRFLKLSGVDNYKAISNHLRRYLESI